MINLALSAYLQVAGELPYSPEDFVQFQHRAGLRALEESVLAAVHHGWNTLSKLEQIGVDRTFEHIISKNCEPTSNIRALFNKEVSKAVRLVRFTVHYFRSFRNVYAEPIRILQ
jgi:hypothetical protein